MVLVCARNPQTKNQAKKESMWETEENDISACADVRSVSAFGDVQVGLVAWPQASRGRGEQTCDRITAGRRGDGGVGGDVLW